MRTLLWARFSHFSKKSRRTRRQAGFTFPFPLPTLLHARLDVSPKGVTVFGDKEENEELSDELTTMLFRVQRSNRAKLFFTPFDSKVTSPLRWKTSRVIAKKSTEVVRNRVYRITRLDAFNGVWQLERF